MIEFESFQFSEVVKLPNNYHVFDMTNGEIMMPEDRDYAVGKYNEHRPNIYTAEQYSDGRDHHIGIDIFGPLDTEICNFFDGIVDQRAYHKNELDYGYTLVLKYNLGGTDLYALYGHLSKRSFDNNPPGKKLEKGEAFAWMGAKHENGGWPVHLHLQLSYCRPEACDMPGVVSKGCLAEALELYPDPQLVLGRLY